MSEKAERIRWMQKYVVVILYAAMALRIVGEYVPALQFVSGLLLAVFFAAELFLLPPVGMAVMCVVVGVLFFLLPAIVGVMLGLLAASALLMFVGAFLCYALSCVIFTFINGALVSVQVVSVTAPASIAAGVLGVSTAISAALGAGVKTTVDMASLSARGRKTRAVLTFLGSLLVLIVVGWPVLSYMGAIHGVLACKPAVILGQAHFDHINLVKSDYEEIFKEEEKWVFHSNFYHKTIQTGNNNIAQGEKNRIAGNDEALAVLLNGLLYVQDPTVDNHIGGAAYLPRETDAMVLNGKTVFIFGRNKVFVCGSQGHYTWKDTRYTTRFEKLSWEEQCEYVFDILERQNTDEYRRFSYDEVGTVACAQRSGLLLDYDRLTRTALFVREEGERMTVFAQNTPGERTEQVSFTPKSADGRASWVMAGKNGVLFIQDGRVMFLSRKDWEQYTSFQLSEGELQTVHYGTVGADDDAYCVYLDGQDRVWVDTRLIGQESVTPFPWNGEQVRLSGFAGEYFYSILYDDNLLSRLTYVQDVRSAADNEETSDTSGYRASEVWMENWTYHRLRLDKRVLTAE